MSSLTTGRRVSGRPEACCSGSVFGQPLKGAEAHERILGFNLLFPGAWSVKTLKPSLKW